MNATDCIQNAWIQQLKFLSMEKDELFAYSLHGNAWDFFFQNRKKKGILIHMMFWETLLVHLQAFNGTSNTCGSYTESKALKSRWPFQIC